MTTLRTTGYEPKLGLASNMEDKSRKRDLSVQRRAAQAVSAAAAASCADDLMESLLEESRSNRTGKGTGGGLLEGLGPMGPPI